CPSGASLSFGAPCTTVRTGVNGHSFASRHSPSGGLALAGQRGRADPGGAQSVLRSAGHQPALPARRHVGVRAAGLFWSRPSALASGPCLARLVGVEGVEGQAEASEASGRETGRTSDGRTRTSSPTAGRGSWPAAIGFRVSQRAAGIGASTRASTPAVHFALPGQAATMDADHRIAALTPATARRERTPAPSALPDILTRVHPDHHGRYVGILAPEQHPCHATE